MNINWGCCPLHRHLQDANYETSHSHTASVGGEKTNYSLNGPAPPPTSSSFLPCLFCSTKWQAKKKGTPPKRARFTRKEERKRLLHCHAMPSLLYLLCSLLSTTMQSSRFASFPFLFGSLSWNMSHHRGELGLEGMSGSFRSFPAARWCIAHCIEWLGACMGWCNNLTFYFDGPRQAVSSFFFFSLSYSRCLT